MGERKLDISGHDPGASSTMVRPQARPWERMAPGSPMWVLVGALVLGGGGGIGANQLAGGDGAKALEATVTLGAEQSKLAQGQADVAQEQADLARDHADQDKRIAAVEKATADTERRMLQAQVRTLRWIAVVLGKQSAAIGAIAKHQGVDVDVDLPPLLEGEFFAEPGSGE